MVYGLGFGFRVWGSGFKFDGLGFNLLRPPASPPAPRPPSRREVDFGFLHSKVDKLVNFGCTSLFPRPAVRVYVECSVFVRDRILFLAFGVQGFWGEEVGV